MVVSAELVSHVSRLSRGGAACGASGAACGGGDDHDEAAEPAEKCCPPRGSRWPCGICGHCGRNGARDAFSVAQYGNSKAMAAGDGGEDGGDIGGLIAGGAGRTCDGGCQFDGGLSDGGLHDDCGQYQCTGLRPRT